MDPATIRSDRWVNGLSRKLADTPTATQTVSACCWTDLLGFSAPFMAADWSPSKEAWDAIGERLFDAHVQCYRNLGLPMGEFIFTLNDGIVRTCDVGRLGHLDLLSLWLRAAIWTHNAIGEREAARMLPGARTVLTAGPALLYGPASIVLDDTVFSYSKANPEKPSPFAEALGNPPIAMNPVPLQMNVAFSKAFILDELGSHVGLEGAHFYVDESFLEALRVMASRLHPKAPVLEEANGDSLLLAVSHDHTRSRYHLGLRLGKPIPVRSRLLTTTVRRLHSFYPHDEDVADFVNLVR